MLNRAQGQPFLCTQWKHLRHAVLSLCCSETSPPTPISAPSMNNYNDRQLEWQHVLQALLSQTRSITVSASRWVGVLRECSVRDANNKRERWGGGRWEQKRAMHGDEWRRSVCMCEPKEGVLRMEKEAKAHRDKQALCKWCSPTELVHFEAQFHSSIGPCTDHSEEVRINYVMLISH